MGDSEQESSDEMPPPQIKRGRPAVKTDSTQRTRRTAQEISDDKIRIAQMELDAVREAEERKLANRKHDLDLKKLLNQSLLCKK